MSKRSNLVSEFSELVGCLGIILFFIALWALLFGVTVGGEHHGISCSCEQGVVIE